MLKINVSPCGGYIALRQLNPIHKKGAIKFKVFKELSLNDLLQAMKLTLITFHECIMTVNYQISVLKTFMRFSKMVK